MARRVRKAKVTAQPEEQQVAEADPKTDKMAPSGHIYRGILI